MEFHDGFKINTFGLKLIIFVSTHLIDLFSGWYLDLDWNFEHEYYSKHDHESADLIILYIDIIIIFIIKKNW